MKFVVPGCNVKLLGKAIHCLAKIGDEVYMEPSKDSLALRTVNSSRSAYATYNFGSSFFSSIETDNEKGASTNMEEERCKVMVRSLLLPFRSLSVLEKTVDSCTLQTGKEDDKMLVSLYCRHSVTKQFNLGLMECEALRVVYDKEKCSNNWIIQARVMQESNVHFLTTQEKVTMYVGMDSFRMKNFNDDYDEKKHVHSEFNMIPADFDHFSISEETSITFCLKELRSLLMFADYLQLAIHASFSQGGQPMVLTVSQGQFINCTYVLATLAEDGGVESERVAPPLTNLTTNTDTNTSHQGYGRLHSTQRDTPANTTCPTLSPNLSTIPKEIPPSLHPTLDNTLKLPPPDFLEGSPPSKRKNFLFRRCFDATFNPKAVEGSEKVLAPDSDEEMA